MRPTDMVRGGVVVAVLAPVFMNIGVHATLRVSIRTPSSGA